VVAGSFVGLSVPLRRRGSAAIVHPQLHWWARATGCAPAAQPAFSKRCDAVGSWPKSPWMSPVRSWLPRLREPHSIVWRSSRVARQARSLIGLSEAQREVCRLKRPARRVLSDGGEVALAADLPHLCDKQYLRAVTRRNYVSDVGWWHGWSRLHRWRWKLAQLNTTNEILRVTGYGSWRCAWASIANGRRATHRAFLKAAKTAVSFRGNCRTSLTRELSRRRQCVLP